MLVQGRARTSTSVENSCSWSLCCFFALLRRAIPFCTCACSSVTSTSRFSASSLRESKLLRMRSKAVMTSASPADACDASDSDDDASDGSLAALPKSVSESEGVTTGVGLGMDFLGALVAMGRRILRSFVEDRISPGCTRLPLRTHTRWAQGTTRSRPPPLWCVPRTSSFN